MLLLYITADIRCVISVQDKHQFTRHVLHACPGHDGAALIYNLFMLNIPGTGEIPGNSGHVDCNMMDYPGLLGISTRRTPGSNKKQVSEHLRLGQE